MDTEAIKFLLIDAPDSGKLSLLGWILFSGSIFALIGAFCIPGVWEPLKTRDSFLVLFSVLGVSICLIIASWIHRNLEKNKDLLANAIPDQIPEQIGTNSEIQLTRKSAESPNANIPKYIELSPKEQVVIDAFLKADSTMLNLKRGNPGVEILLKKNVIKSLRPLRGGATFELDPEVFQKLSDESKNLKSKNDKK